MYHLNNNRCFKRIKYIKKGTNSVQKYVFIFYNNMKYLKPKQTTKKK